MMHVSTKQILIDSNLFDSVEYNTTRVRALIHPYNFPISERESITAYKNSWNVMYNDKNCWYVYGDFEHLAKDFDSPELATEYVISDAKRAIMEEAIG